VVDLIEYVFRDTYLATDKENKRKENHGRRKKNILERKTHDKNKDKKIRHLKNEEHKKVTDKLNGEAISEKQHKRNVE
jgi:uncharacterized protein YacL